MAKMNLTMSKPGLVVTGVMIVLGIYDLYLVTFHGTGSTISTFMIEAGFKSPALVFVAGYLCGHFFGYMWSDSANPEK